MDSDKARDPQALAWEMPQHVVAVDAFQMARFPVTVAEYACAVWVKAVRRPPWGRYPSIAWQDQLRRPEHPVVCVSWHDALAYVSWLTEITSQPWRLPTEAEREKAARGTDGRLYPWGDQ